MNVDSFSRYLVLMDGVDVGLFSSNDMAQLFGRALLARYPNADVRIAPRVR